MSGIDAMNSFTVFLYVLLSAGLGLVVGRTMMRRPNLLFVIAILCLPTFLAWRLHRIGFTTLALAHLLPVSALVVLGYWWGVRSLRRKRIGIPTIRSELGDTAQEKESGDGNGSQKHDQGAP